MVMLAAIMTALIAMLGFYIGIKSFPDIPEEFIVIISKMFTFKIVFMILTLIIPISAFFSALILSLSIYAKSFKEAQSMITPFNMAIIFPALLGTLPGIELNYQTALIPIINVALATKDVLAGTINPILLIEVYLSLLIFASISLLFCVKWFQREETLFRV
jgi:sodium transport system permease protein